MSCISRRYFVGCVASLSRSLEEFDAAVSVHGKTLEKDLLIKHHLGILYDQLLESNLLKIIQVCTAPAYGCRGQGLAGTWSTPNVAELAGLARSVLWKR